MKAHKTNATESFLIRPFKRSKLCLKGEIQHESEFADKGQFLKILGF
jgi:hypothetical protein